MEPLPNLDDIFRRLESHIKTYEAEVRYLMVLLAGLKPSPMPRGWVCPRCWNCYAPSLTECPRCNAEKG
jgi:hypothetical protein